MICRQNLPVEKCKAHFRCKILLLLFVSMIRYEAKKKLRKEQEKMKRKAVREKKIAESQAALSKMSEEELVAWREARAMKVAERQNEREERRNRLQAAIKSGQRIVIDLEFENLMTDNELKSISQQLAYCYGANTRAPVPAHLILSGVKGKMLERLNCQMTGIGNWLVTLTQESYIDYFAKLAKGQLVYLTADSPYEIEELETDKIYIVGGLVDRNRHKGVCFDKAQSQGIATARLPIGEYMKLASSQVMCTNHVVEILIRWLELRDWEGAFKAVIPTRKRKVDGEQDPV